MYPADMATSIIATPGQLGSEDTIVLAELNEQAYLFAPQFCQDFMIQVPAILYEASTADRAYSIREWFLSLFAPEDYSSSYLHHPGNKIPISEILAGMDIILHYGKLVTQKSQQQDKANQAFYKALLFQALNAQWELQATRHHLYEMMLLD
ncbi:MAG: hypothetical protein JW862_06525 [Anaerolineales bacterium]|nr:hypothetical protein [Anaerolineales bacterium]